jgi:hypothetical protein
VTFVGEPSAHKLPGEDVRGMKMGSPVGQKTARRARCGSRRFARMADRTAPRRVRRERCLLFGPQRRRWLPSRKAHARLRATSSNRKLRLALPARSGVPGRAGYVPLERAPPTYGGSFDALRAAPTQSPPPKSPRCSSGIRHPFMIVARRAHEPRGASPRPRLATPEPLLSASPAPRRHCNHDSRFRGPFLHHPHS